MRQILSFGVAALAVAAFVSTTISQAQDKDKPKHSIKDVMKLAHKEKLLNKVLDGQASKEEKQKLHDLYLDMSKAEPPKGDKESWKKLNDALVAAAKDVVEGKDGAAAALKKASNCGACHSAHKK